jgi:hypothetical protein
MLYGSGHWCQGSVNPNYGSGPDLTWTTVAIKNLCLTAHVYVPVRYLMPVLRIRDVYPGSRILIFTHPGSRISDPGSKNSNKRER